MRSRSIAGAVLLTLIMLASTGKATAELIGTLERLSPAPTTFIPGVHFVTFNAPASQSATGDATGMLSAVDLGSGTSGCDPADFAGFASGSIAIVDRGGCFFSDKTINAQNAGAVGILIVNNFDVVGSGDGLGMIDPTAIPALFVDDDAGVNLLSIPGARVHMTVVRVADVPAPASLALLSLGLAAFGWSRRHK